MLPIARCPTCRKRGDWFATPHGPFCSDRCRLVDLGAWLSEEHRIPGPLNGGGSATESPDDVDAADDGVGNREPT